MEARDESLGETPVPGDLPRDPAETYDPAKTRTAVYLARRRAEADTRASAAENAEAPKFEPCGGDDDSDTPAATVVDAIPLPPLPLPPDTATNPSPAVELSAPEVERAQTYTLRQVIGRGGVGEVWEARQASLQRVIAVKRLREDIYRRVEAHESQARAYEQMFMQEALTTGSLEHPNIVPVYDYRVDKDGRPLLAMKLVKGKPWDKLIREQFAETSSAEFLARHLPILVDVAQAVAYAHSRGVAHRDIKPSQVMVGEFGEVLLMDWGLAVHFLPEEEREASAEEEARREAERRASSAPSVAGVSFEAGASPGDTVFDAASSGSNRDDISPFPRHASRATNPSGTPAYMAPEQTRAGGGVGPWTDIYLLGGTLFHLLTGKHPRDSNDSSKVFEMATRGEISPMEPSVPGREIPSELADLCLRAMAKKPEDRVASALEFIQGLRDYMSGANKRRESALLVLHAGQRVERCGPDYAELSAAMDLLDRAIGLWPENPQAGPLRRSVLSRFVAAAIEHRDLVLARMHAERLRGEEREAFLRRIEALEEEQRLAAERLRLANERVRRERDHAEDLIDFMMVDLHHNLKDLGRLDVIEKIARMCREHYDSLPETEEQSGETLLRRAAALRNIGDVMSDQGESEAAVRAYRDSLDVAVAAEARKPGDRAARASVADSWRKIGEALYGQRDVAGARDAYAKALAIRKPLAEEDPADKSAANELSWVYEWLGVASRRVGELGDALEAHIDAIAIRECLLRDQPDNPRWLADLSWSLNSIAVVYEKLGDFASALQAFRKAAAIRRKLAEADPKSATHKRGLSWSLASTAQLLRQMGDLPGAAEAFGQALDILEGQAELDPTNDAVRRDLAWTRGSLGRVAREMGDLRFAQELVESALETQARLLEKDAARASVRHELSWSAFELARVLEARGLLERALAQYREALVLREHRRLENVANPIGHHEAAQALHRVATLRLKLKKEPEHAPAELARAKELIDQAVPDVETADLEFLETRVWILLTLGDLEGARATIERMESRGWRSGDRAPLRAAAGMEPATDSAPGPAA